MKKYTFRKLEDSIFATGGGWTSEFTPDGEVDTSLEHHLGNEIPQVEAEKILQEYGWSICDKCGHIIPDGQDCMCQLQPTGTVD